MLEPLFLEDGENTTIFSNKLKEIHSFPCLEVIPGHAREQLGFAQQLTLWRCNLDHLKMWLWVAAIPEEKAGCRIQAG